MRCQDFIITQTRARSLYKYYLGLFVHFIFTFLIIIFCWLDFKFCNFTYVYIRKKLRLCSSTPESVWSYLFRGKEEECLSIFLVYVNMRIFGFQFVAIRLYFIILNYKYLLLSGLHNYIFLCTSTEI
ncbi:hypothetical protein AAZX31_12G207100 [Glycine max]|uniref:Uncharacterized protein n=1 Tax=Glycine max TaxID=3847 RepID=K7LWB4_SOYBN|nr:hypothetical protein JHK85_035351 [Glycine max]KAG4987015.1 hypothetical protein JHK86_034706 [Glycine max]KAG5120213.1 hypothetical protein JHK82_034633 [Glycine max]KAG5141199.1 hypothetical protein JHK84_034967 [Glycine max]KAH1144356.1 hypothetical protein GYH30_034535 [Glycine max]